MELIKHIFGFCGENHPNILLIIFGYFSFITYIIKAIKIKYKWKEVQ